MEFFVRLDSWLSAVIFSCLMVVAWWLGDRGVLTGRRAAQGPANPRPSTRIEDATLALFGLLLFTSTNG